MKVFYTIAVLCMATCASAKDPITVENCGKSLLSPDSADRIVGGENAKHGMYPWMVSLYANHDRWGFLCGATILNEHWVVTAAHCILYKHSPDRYKIYAGINELFDNQPTAQEHKISDTYVHEDYDTMTFSNDIALLRTSTKINIAGSGGYVNGICLPQDNNNPEGLGIVTGWGVDKTGGHLSNVLQRVTVPIVRCPRKPENMICAGAENKDSCKSDSGGPLLQRDENGIATLVGIVSHGTGCGLKWFPGVYTKVSYYRDWMLRTIQGKDT